MIKKIAIFLTLLLFHFCQSFSQWEWLNPKPSGYSCSKIIFTDSLRGFILKSNGDLITTTDQGESWQFLQNFPGAITMDLKDSTAVISGYSGTVYLSKDNGSSWQKKETGSTDNFSMVDIVSRDTFFLANYTGRIYRTGDRGQSWRNFDCGIQISSFEFINSSIGYVGGSNAHILKTLDGGISWKESVNVTFSPSNTLTIKFTDINTGFAFREHSTILKTKNGGKNWEEYRIGDKIYSFFFLNNNTGFATGEYGVTYRTDDGGTTWNWAAASARIDMYHLYSVWFINSKTGFTVGARGRILKTTDGGASWNSYSPTYIGVSDIFFTAKSTAYATVGNIVYKTYDRWQTWKELKLPVNPNNDHRLQYCHFINSDSGFVTSTDQARVYTTTDGGQTWQMANLAPYGYDYVSGMHFINSKIGFLSLTSSGSARMVKTKDGGFTWSDAWVAKYMNEGFQKVFFTDEKTGYASAYRKLYKTEDSAKTWSELWDQEYDNISAIWFTNAKTGFVTGENGMLKRTDDGGTTWTTIRLTEQFYDDIYAIKFIDEQIGYLTAEGGAIYKTTDGGRTWKQNGEASFYTIRAINFGPDSSIYVAGEYGSIMGSHVSEYTIDKFYTRNLNDCTIGFYSDITSILSSVDSIRFEYGIDNFDSSITASPSEITNKQQSVSASVTNLLPSTIYKVRLKLFFRGQYYYSKEAIFSTPGKPAAPVVKASGDTTFCQGANVTLTSSASSGNQWYLNGVTINGATNQSYNATESGMFQVVTTKDCYSSDTSSIIVMVKALPTKPTITNAGNILYSSAATGNQWLLNGTIISGATDKQYEPRQNGAYSVKIADGNCESPVSDTINFVIPGSTLIAYPNPVEDYVVIRNTIGEEMSIRLTDATGNVIYQAESSVSSYKMDLRRLKAGSYFIRVSYKGSNTVEVKMIVKQ